MSDRSPLYAAPLLGLLLACPIEGTLGVYRGDTTASDAGSASDPTAGVDGVCVLDETDDCSECLRSACCETLPACEAPADCNCMFACIAAGTPASECVDTCTPGKATKDFSVCAMKACASTCEGAAP